MMFRVFYVLFVMVASVACSEHSITKRHLNWQKDEQMGYKIKSLSASIGDIVVDHLTSHPENVEVFDNQVYMSFVLYRDDEIPVEPNGGIFHFIDIDTANKLRVKCEEQKIHAGAYYYFYGRCPEHENDLVASGYCYQGRRLVYNSYTFNLEHGYTDGRYYLGNDEDKARQVHTIEQNLLNTCFNKWKNNGFVTENWSCNFDDMSIEEAEDPPLKCTMCDYPCPSSAPNLPCNHGNKNIAGFVVMFLLVSWNLYIALGVLSVV